MKLPSVYANKIDKVIKNNVDVAYGERNVKKKDLTKLKNCFDSRGYANKLSVDIVTKDGKKNEKLILCVKDYFVNIDNKKIFFDEILDYEIKN